MEGGQRDPHKNLHTANYFATPERVRDLLVLIFYDYQKKYKNT